MNVARNVLRRVISKLANFTPSVVYYPSGWLVSVGGVLKRVCDTKANGNSPMTIAAVSVACAMHDHLPKVGDSAEIKIVGVSYGDGEIGSFTVTVVRDREA